MARDNPSNPFTQDPGHTQQDVPMPVQKAKVMAAPDHPDEDGFHTVRIRVYGDQATYMAPVLTPMFGSVWVPKKGQDVAVIFGSSDKPWVIGAWYPLDRVEDGEVDLPDYQPGDMRVGNESGAHVTVHDDGSVEIVSTDDAQATINGLTMETSVENPLTVPHTEWTTALDSTEVWRLDCESNERLVVYRLETKFKGGGTDPDFNIDLYDVTTGSVIASTSDVVTGDPVGMSDLGSTVIARLTNNTSGIQVASLSSKLAIAKE